MNERGAQGLGVGACAGGAILFAATLTNCLSAPWYDIEFTSRQPGQPFGAIEVTAWEALSFIDIAVAVVAATSAALAFVGVIRGDARAFVASAFVAGVAVALIAYRLIELPVPPEEFRHFSLVFEREWGTWASLIASSLTLASAGAAAGLARQPARSSGPEEATGPT